MLYYYLLFQLTNEIINSFIETNYGYHNFIHITNKVACRARRDVLRVACCTACAYTAHTTFSYTKMHGLVTLRNRWNMDFTVLYKLCFIIIIIIIVVVVVNDVAGSTKARSRHRRRTTLRACVERSPLIWFRSSTRVSRFSFLRRSSLCCLACPSPN